MDVLKILLRDSRFWAAVLALANTILLYFFPDFPEPIWASINALFAVILAVIASQSAIRTETVRREAREAATREAASRPRQ